MKPQPTINGLTLRILSARDWLELARDWVGREQSRIEVAMRRAGANGVDIARAVEEFAKQNQTYSVLSAMCKTIDGSLAILDRSAQRAGVSKDSLTEALTGVDPEEVILCAYRCLGFTLVEQGSADPNASSRQTPNG